MKAIIPGHTYDLPKFEEPTNTIRLQFIHKEPLTTGIGLRTVCDGTTNEDVLDVLIDRMYYLQKQFPCRENAIVITKLEECLMWLNKRTADRIKRNVEGKHEA